MRASILLCIVVLGLGLVHANNLGAFRKRFNGNPNPMQDDTRYRTSMPMPIAPPVIMMGLPPPPPPSVVGPPTDEIDLPPPVRPNIYLQTENYLVFDKYHSRYLSLFDPEAWVATYPGIPFPPELDVPPNWFVYNPVTVQAPKPFIDEFALQQRYYTGYYYACPERANPYNFSWMMKNDPINPCKWTFFQNRADFMRQPYPPYPYQKKVPAPY